MINMTTKSTKLYVVQGELTPHKKKKRFSKDPNKEEIMKINPTSTAEFPYS